MDKHPAAALVDMVYESGYQAGLDAAQPKWISVKDNPPDGTKDVIAYNAFGEMMIGRVYETRRGIYKCEYGYGEDMLSVTHWIPRPEPPKEETR